MKSNFLNKIKNCVYNYNIGGISGKNLPKISKDIIINYQRQWGIVHI
jgi:hypothetical protein